MPPQGNLLGRGLGGASSSSDPESSARAASQSEGLLQPPQSLGSLLGWSCYEAEQVGGEAPRCGQQGLHLPGRRRGSQAGSRTRGQGAMTITRGGVPAWSSDSNFDASVFPVGTSEQPSESPTNSGWLATPFCRPQRTPSAHGERGPPHTCPRLQSPPLPHAACHRRASDLIHSIAVRLIGDTPRPTSVAGTLPTILFSAPQK